MQGGARAAGSARSCDELRRTLRRPVAAGWFSRVGPRELEVACDRYKCYPILVCAERDFRRLRICRGTPLKTPHLALNGECFQFTLAQNSPDFLVSRQPFGARPFGGLSTAQPQVYGLHCLSSVQVLPRVGLLEFFRGAHTYSYYPPGRPGARAADGSSVGCSQVVQGRGRRGRRM